MGTWEKQKLISTSSSLDTSTPVNPPPPVTSSTNVVVLTSEPSKSSKKKPPKWVKVLSNTLGFWTSLRPNENEVSPSISLSGNSRPTCTKSPSSMLQVTEISSRT